MHNITVKYPLKIEIKYVVNRGWLIIIDNVEVKSGRGLRYFMSSKSAMSYISTEGIINEE